MSRLRLALLPALLLVVVAAAPASASPHRHGDPVLLSLGDSVAAGVGTVPYVTGYPELTGALLSLGYNPSANKATGRFSTHFDVENLAVPGATTTSLLANQLPAALALINARQADRDPKNDVEVVTLTIGGNDVFQPVLAACVLVVTPTGCQVAAEASIAQVSAGVTEALRQLTAAAGKHVEVVVTTYYNPIGSCFVTGLNPAAPAIADVVLEGGEFPATLPFLALSIGVNDAIREAADVTGAQVAELYGALGPRQYVGGPDCLHPNFLGHATIARVVSSTLKR